MPRPAQRDACILFEGRLQFVAKRGADTAVLVPMARLKRGAKPTLKEFLPTTMHEETCTSSAW